MTISKLLVDLDDTIYPSSSGIWGLIGERIDLFIHNRLQLDWNEIPALRQEYFNQYGTTMRGLIINHHIDPEDYLKFVHEVPIESLIHPDPELRSVLASLPQTRFIFTNSDEHHARRVLRALQLEDLFEAIIDVHLIAPFCKPQPEAFLAAMQITGEENPGACVIVDDSLRNLQAARLLGFHTVYVGSKSDHDGAELSIRSLKELDIAQLGSNQPAKPVDQRNDCA
jgi:putative hydrolase of the HAD superfamily